MATKEQTRKILAKTLARYFGEDTAHPIACACTGLSGVCVDCSIWWEMVLEQYSKRDIEKMFDLYFFCENEVFLKR